MTAPGNGSSFATTRWTMVCAARDGKDSSAQVALSELCQAYWRPLYGYVRRRGASESDAQDLTQSFFAWLLERQPLASLQPSGGRFRAFLLTCLKNFLNNQHDREHALKRGGGVQHLRLDFDQENRAIDPADTRQPESSFERQWALCLLEKVEERLRLEYADPRKAAWYEALHPLLAGAESVPQESIAARLGSTSAAVKAALHRMRRRFRELLRDEIAQTVASSADIDAEIRDLFAALQE